VILIVVGQEVTFPHLHWLAVLLYPLEIVAGVAILVNRAFRTVIVEFFHALLKHAELLWNHLFEIVADEAEVLVSVVEFLHYVLDLGVVAGDKGRCGASVVYKLVQEMANVGVYSAVFDAVGI
jgi:hypothetical protein